jgi:hypothetical protein
MKKEFSGDLSTISVGKFSSRLTLKTTKIIVYNVSYGFGMRWGMEILGLEGLSGSAMRVEKRWKKALSRDRCRDCSRLNLFLREDFLIVLDSRDQFQSSGGELFKEILGEDRLCLQRAIR